MTHASPMPPAPQPRPSQSTKWYRRVWAIAAFAAVGGIIVGAASAGSNKSDAEAAPATTVTATATMTSTAPAPPAATKTLQPIVKKVIATRTRTRTETYTPPPQPSITDGVYEVGSDIKPGQWRTDGGGDGSNAIGCYYAILNSTESSDIADNGTSTGPMFATLDRGQYFELTGGCEWRRR